MKNNFKRLGDTLSNRMNKVSGAAVPLTVELGIVNSNMSITTDSLKTQIPRGDYMVNLVLTGRGSAGGDGGNSPELPEAFRGLQAGDRVLVAWCGNEPVVMAIVASS